MSSVFFSLVLFSLTQTPHGAPVNQVSVEVLSQRVELIQPHTKRYLDRGLRVLVRKVRYEVRNAGSRPATFFWSRQPLQIDSDGRRLSHGVMRPAGLWRCADPGILETDLQPGVAQEFDCTYPHDRRFTAEFGLRLQSIPETQPDPEDKPTQERRQKRLPRRKSAQGESTDETPAPPPEILRVRVPAVPPGHKLVPVITVESIKEMKRQVRSDRGPGVETHEYVKVKYRVRNPSRETMMFSWTEPIREPLPETFAGCPLYVQTLSWSVMFDRLPDLFVKIVPPQGSVEFACEYGVKGSFATEFGYAMSPSEEDLRTWRELARLSPDGMSEYGRRFEWLTEKLRVIQVQVPFVAGKHGKNHQP